MKPCLKKFDFLSKNDDNRTVMGEILKSTVFVLIFLGIIVSFQNCGETAGEGLISQHSELLSSDCSESDSCQQSSDFLWMKIREYEPYKIQLSTVNVGHFNVGGQCGVGQFESHSFIWELRKGFGNQEVVGRGFADNRCEFGQFSVPIIPNQLALEPDQRYTLTMELVGISDSSGEVSNSMTTNQDALDIVFTVDPPN